MNKELAEEVILLKEEIEKEPLIIEYKKIRNRYECDEDLQKLVNKLKYLKSCSMNEEEKEEYFKAKEELQKNPLHSNYETLKKEVKDFKLDIKQILKL